MRIIIIVCLLCLVCTSTEAQNDEQIEHKYGMNAKFFIPPEKLPQLEKKALNGDNHAASQLFDYYILVKNDYQKTRFWLEIAAENGDVGAYMNLISLLSSDFPPKAAEQKRYDDERLCFWVRKAIAAGVKLTQVQRTARKKCNLLLKSQ